MWAFLADFGNQYRDRLYAVLFVLFVAYVFKLMEGILW
mgnify:CR=1 FL=1